MMHKLFIALLALLIASPSLAQQVTQGVPGSGQLPGTATNDNANAGNVGEYGLASNAETGTAGGAASGVTVTIASPAVVTWPTTTPFGFAGGAGCSVVNFTTTGALPTGLAVGTNYYVISSSVSGNTFQLATTCDNAMAGTAINTSGTQSGTHSGVSAAILASGSTIDIAGVTLTAGDWDVWVDEGFQPSGTTSITLMALGSSTVTGTAQTKPGQATWASTAAQVPSAFSAIFHAGPRRYSLSSSTKIYANALGIFTVSTLQAWGGIRARRVR